MRIQLPPWVHRALRHPLSWTVAGVVAILVVARIAAQDSRIPEQPGFPQESVTPLFRDPQNTASAFCPRNDYTLKWVVWAEEFVPRCLPKHPYSGPLPQFDMNTLRPADPEPNKTELTPWDEAAHQANQKPAQ